MTTTFLTSPLSLFLIGTSGRGGHAPKRDARKVSRDERRAHLNEVIERNPAAFTGDVDLYAIMSVYPRDF